MIMYAVVNKNTSEMHLLEVPELAEGFGFNGVGKLGYLAQFIKSTIYIDPTKHFIVSVFFT